MIPCFIFTLLILTLQTHTINSNNNYSNNNNLITRTCKKSSQNDPNINYAFCINSLHSSPSSYHANLTRLGLISINLAKHNASHTTSLIKTLITKNHVDTKTSKALKDCQELYSNTVSMLLEAARDYRAQRFDDANVKISSVIDDSSTCQQGFEDFGVFSPLSKENGYAFQLCAIALSIMNMVSSH